MNDTAILILAAGNSSRLGRAKQLLSFKGTTMLNTVINEALKSRAHHIVVVLGANFREIITSLPKANERLKVVTNDHWPSGMGSSIKLGVNFITESNPSIKNIIISTCDQPYISSNVFDDLINCSDTSSVVIIASKYNNASYGVPVLFKRSLFDALSRIEDTNGAKSIIELNLNHTGFVDFAEGAIDIDSANDLQHLKPNI